MSCKNTGEHVLTSLQSRNPTPGARQSKNHEFQIYVPKKKKLLGILNKRSLHENTVTFFMVSVWKKNGELFWLKLPTNNFSWRQASLWELSASAADHLTLKPWKQPPRIGSIIDISSSCQLHCSCLWLKVFFLLLQWVEPSGGNFWRVKDVHVGTPLAFATRIEMSLSSVSQRTLNSKQCWDMCSPLWAKVILWVIISFYKGLRQKEAFLGTWFRQFGNLICLNLNSQNY